jgi:hypothetical protein
MKVRARVVMGGARMSDPTPDFPQSSWFCSFMDDEGNAFDNVYAKGDVFSTPPEVGSVWNLGISISKNRDGRLRLQVIEAAPAAPKT